MFYPKSLTTSIDMSCFHNTIEHYAYDCYIVTALASSHPTFATVNYIGDTAWLS